MKAAAPAEGGSDRGESLAVVPEPVGIIAADAFDAADDDLVAFFDACKSDSSIERQVFFRWIDDLQQMALEPGRGEAGDGH